MQLFDRGHHPHICTGLVENIFTALVSVLFMECQLHIIKIKSLILRKHMSHMHGNFRCKHTSIRTHVQI